MHVRPPHQPAGLRRGQAVRTAAVPISSSPQLLSSARPIYCRPEYLGSQFGAVDAEGGVNLAGSLQALTSYYKRLGCTPEEITAGVLQMHAPVPGDVLTTSAWWMLTELGIAGVFALLLLCYQDRPVGWVAADLVEAKPSDISGTGLFARVDVPAGTPLGAYPGRVRSTQDMAQKLLTAPDAAQFAFLTSDGMHLDPTDANGQLSKYPAPGWPWPLPSSIELAYANEPKAGGRGTNCFVEDGASPSELLFITSRSVAAGEEILIDYGRSYNRSGYT